MPSARTLGFLLGATALAFVGSAAFAATVTTVARGVVATPVVVAQAVVAASPSPTVVAADADTDAGRVPVRPPVRPPSRS